MHRFYNPSLSAAEIDWLDWENWLTLMSVQAFLGEISDNTLGIAVEPRPEAVTVRVALRRESAADNDRIEEALVSLDVFLNGHVAIDHAVIVGQPDVREWQSSGWRFVFLRDPG